jgi:phosphoglucomutase
MGSIDIFIRKVFFMSYKAKYRDWLISDYFDEETKTELENIKDDEEEIEDRFYTDLSFGTGGMRGKIGAGTNRINKYIVRKATQGLANYIVNYSEDGRERGVVIAYDSRHKSPKFAKEAALVLNGNGIKTYLFD